MQIVDCTEIEFFGVFLMLTNLVIGASLLLLGVMMSAVHSRLSHRVRSYDRAQTLKNDDSGINIVHGALFDPVTGHVESDKRLNSEALRSL